MNSPEGSDLLSPEQMIRMADALEKQARAQLETAKNLRALAENSRVNRLTPEGRERISKAAKDKWARERQAKAAKSKKPV